ncbi:MAG: hypothetical protein R3B36_34515 [Polyangiaceae bacterium]
MRWCVLSAATAVLAGCSLITNLDGLSDPGASDAGASDAVAPGDASATEASVDAAADGPPPGVDAGVPFCKTVTPAPFFCADFEDGRTARQIFTSVEEHLGATVSVDNTDGRSSTGSLVLRFPGTAGAEGAARVTLPASLTKLSVELDLRIDSFGEGDEHDFVGVFRNSAREAGLEVRPSGQLAFDEDVPADGGGDEEIKTGLARVLTSGWAHVTWVVVVEDDLATSVVSVDGTQIGTVRSSPEPFLDSELVFGETVIGKLEKEWRSRIDNIVVRVE